MTKNLLVCGDSFMITDPGYPGLHWSEKLGPNVNVSNFAMGGSTNGMIATQVRQGLNFNFDAVVIGFTSSGRVAIDKDKLQNITKAEINDIINDNGARWTTDCYEDSISYNQRLSLTDVKNFASMDMIKLSEYYIILSTLYLLTNKNIPFIFSMGGISITDKLLDWYSVPNELEKFNDFQLTMNLWDYPLHKRSPYFHVDDEKTQTNFATTVLSMLKWN